MSVTCEKKLRCDSRRSALWSATADMLASVESAPSSPASNGAEPWRSTAIAPCATEFAGSGTAAAAMSPVADTRIAGRPDSTEQRTSSSIAPACAV